MEVIREVTMEAAKMVLYKVVMSCNNGCDEMEPCLCLSSDG